MEMKITITNLSRGEAAAIEEMFAVWMYEGRQLPVSFSQKSMLLLAEQGPPRIPHYHTVFLAGGGFNPRVVINGRAPQLSTLAHRDIRAMYRAEDDSLGNIYKIDAEEVDALMYLLDHPEKFLEVACPYQNCKAPVGSPCVDSEGQPKDACYDRIGARVRTDKR